MVLWLSACAGQFGWWPHGAADPASTPLPEPGPCLEVDALLTLPEERELVAVAVASTGERVLSLTGPRPGVSIGSGHPGEPPQWFKEIAEERVHDVGVRELTQEGGTWLVGTFNREVTLDVGLPSELILEGTRSSQIALVRQDPTHHVTWGLVIEDEAQVQLVGLAALSDDGLLLAAQLYNMDHPDRDQEGRLYRFGADGELIWVRSLWGTRIMTIRGLALDEPAGVVTLAGIAEGDGEVWFADDPEPDFVVEPSGRESWIAQYDLDGQPRWVTTGTGRQVDASAVASIGDGSVVVAGHFLSPMAMAYGRPSAQSLLDPSGAAAAWLGRFDDEGELVWLERTTPGLASQAHSSELVVQGDHVYWRGTAMRDFGFGDPPWVQFATEREQSFLAVVGVDGSARCATGSLIGDAQRGVSDLYPETLRALPDGRVVFLGSARGTWTLAAGTELERTSTKAEEDGLVWEMVLRLPD